MKIVNIKTWVLSDYHIIIWKNTTPEFKLVKIDNRMYKKYSLYLGEYIYEIGKLKYGTNNKSVRTIKK
jgi:hypothetical protein